jgi:hypothetical protein
MPIKSFPQDLIDLLNREGWVEAYPALDIELSDGSMLHYSTTELFDVEGADYTPYLGSVKSIKSSLSRAVDRAELTIDNADLAVGDILLDESADELLDNMKGVLHWVYKTPTGAVYRITKMSGLIYTFAEDGSKDLTMTIIADPYAGLGVAPYAVKQNCVWQYKDGINCDYAGGLPTCDFTLDGANGCIAHFGTDMAKARFGGGAVDLTETARTNFEFLDNGDDGDGLPTPYCFMAGTPVWIDESFATRPIETFKTGDPILGAPRRTLEMAPDVAETDSNFLYYKEWYDLMFSDGSAIEGVTGAHPFYPEPGREVPVADMQLGDKFRRFVPGRGWRTVKLVGKLRRESKVPVPFYTVPVRGAHGYWVNGYPVSNKRIDINLPY